MNKQTKEQTQEERRRVNQTDLIDTAMRSANQLFTSKDHTTRSAASRVLGDLQKIRAVIPRRRLDDGKKLHLEE